MLKEFAVLVSMTDNLVENNIGSNRRVHLRAFIAIVSQSQIVKDLVVVSYSY